jgi:hypothetical protein
LPSYRAESELPSESNKAQAVSAIINLRLIHRETLETLFSSAGCGYNVFYYCCLLLSRRSKPGAVQMWSKAIAYYLSFAVVGAAMGFGSWCLQFTEFTAIKVIAVDRITGEYVTDPVILVETIKSQGFAKKVAERSGIPDLAHLLPSVNYGGQQKLNVRNFGNPPTAVELRVSLPTAEMARTAMDAVGDEIALLQSKKTKAFLDALSKPPPSAQQLGVESPLAIGNEQASQYQLALNKALIEAAIKTRAGQAVETSVVPRSGPSMLVLAGAVGMLCVAVLIRILTALPLRMFLIGSSMNEPTEPALRELSQATSVSDQEPSLRP